MARPDRLPMVLRATVRNALGVLQQATGVPLLFSGIVVPDAPGRPRRMRLSDFAGAHSGALAELEVAPCAGLGGRAAGSGLPQIVSDYRSSRMISHEYDGQVVEAESLSSVCALPLAAHGAVVAVVYLATRDGVLGGQVLRAADGFVRRLGRDLEIRAGGSDPAEVTSTAGAIAALDDVLVDTTDPRTRGRLVAVRRHLAAGLAPLPDGAATLTPRELDVLRRVARGWTNRRIGEDLGLREPTVKAYLSTAMRKLGAGNRTAAAHVARAAGLI